MKVFQSRHHEVLLNESVNGEEFMALYNALLAELLRVHNISGKKIFEAIVHYKISSKPAVAASLLRSKELPPFQFLICKN